MRTIKKHEERKNEILDIAEILFYTKGYDRCTINDILNETKIAKGTFYHYFVSKEEVLDGIVNRNIETIVNRVRKVIESNDIEPVEKLMRVFMAMRLEHADKNEVLNNLHKPENAILHQKNLNQLIGVMTPILVSTIEEGIEKKVWHCMYPKQFMQIFMAAAFTLTDEGIFEADAESQEFIMVALVSILEKMLEVEKGSLLKLFLENWD